MLKEQTDGKPARRALLRDTLLFLAWSDLQDGTLADVILTLSVLDRRFPASAERLALRWELMQCLLRNRSYSDYQSQTKLFLSDSISVNYGGAVLEAFREVYSNLSWKPRVGLGDSVHASLVADPRVRASLNQWRCPLQFASRNEAASWKQKIAPEHLDFAPKMKTDALIALGQVAEWDRDWAGMEARAREALQILPEYPRAVFLLTRSLLRQAGSSLPEELAKAILLDEPKWHRLRLQCKLREQGGLEQAEDLIALLPQAADDGDLLELDLSIQLLETVLTLPTARRPEHVAQLAKLCSQLKNLPETFLRRLPFLKCSCDHCGEVLEAPRELEKLSVVCSNCRKNVTVRIPQSAAQWLPWTEVGLALKHIHIDRDYVSAFQRLEISALESYTPARLLARVARWMAGSPRGSEEKNLAVENIDALARALHAVAGRSKVAGDWKKLETGVSTALADDSLREFPALIVGAEILCLAMRLLGGDKGAKEDTLRYSVPEVAPLWAVWLFSRMVQTLSTGSDSEALMRRIPLAGPSVAWFMEVWCYNYGKLHAEFPAAASNAQELLNRGLPPSPLRRARLRGYRQTDIPADYVLPKDAFTELGEICGAHARQEIALELEMARSRSVLADGSPAEAATQFTELRGSLDSIGPLAVSWWHPLITLWLGIAQAQQHESDAERTFETLLDGPCAGASRGQLALLALREGSLEQAARWIAGGWEHVPSVRYADALLLARRGSLNEARQRLDSPEAMRILAGSSYALAARRLVAALAERSGYREESEQLLAATLASYPGDAIASARLGRIRIEKSYSHFRATGEPRDAASSLQPEVSGTAKDAMIAWWRPYSILHTLVSESNEALPKLETAVAAQFGVGAGSMAWRQVLAHRFLRANDAARAFQVLEVARVPEESPRWFTRARMVLAAWRWLTRLSQEDARAAAIQKLRECSQALISLGQDGNDSPSALWGSVVDLALRVESTGSLEALMQGSQLLGAAPFCYVHGLWSETAQKRRLAGEAIQSAIDQDGARWNEEQTLLLHALAAWAQEKDEDYIEQYTILEPVLDELPMRGRDLWVPAALIRFSKCDWQGLAGDRLPDCIADMSDPLVCLIVELVDARAAASDLRKPSQAVAHRIKGIQNNLAALVERLDSERSCHA